MLVTSFIMLIFVALFICFRIPFVCLLNDFTDSVVTYGWQCIYNEKPYPAIQLNGLSFSKDLLVLPCPIER